MLDEACDDNLIYLEQTNDSPSNAKKSSAKTPQEANNKERSLGRWFYEKKTKKKRYVSLSGETFHGKQATIKFIMDKQFEVIQRRHLTRRELTNMMKQNNYLSYINNDHNTVNDTESILNPDYYKLDTWGIPFITVQKYEKKGFNQLFQWQIDCLTCHDGHALKGGNLVFSAPTSGGKTMVAEILMLRRLALVPGTIIFIVPYVALVVEKSEYFREMWMDMGQLIYIYYTITIHSIFSMLLYTLIYYAYYICICLLYHRYVILYIQVYR